MRKESVPSSNIKTSSVVTGTTHLSCSCAVAVLRSHDRGLSSISFTRFIQWHFIVLRQALNQATMYCTFMRSALPDMFGMTS